MNVLASYVKTPKGKDEIQTRKNKLSVRQRNLLIMVDGIKTVSELSEISIKLGLSADDLAQLDIGGFIAPVAPTATAGTGAPELFAAMAAQTDAPVVVADEAIKFRVAHKFMNDTVVNSLGLKAFFFTLKLERCATRADLSDLLSDFSKVLGKAIGVAEAEVLVGHARELLG